MKPHLFRANKMGFDIYIKMSMMVCPETGRPFYYKKNKETGKTEKLYEFPSVIIPEHLRKYITGRGSHFNAYIEGCVESMNCDVDFFLDRFPSWEDVQIHECYDDSWTSDDHFGFEDLLIWCNEQDVPFEVCWSY